MDREKLAKASFDFVLSENKYPESACGYLQEVFERGADWLMQQPLSERLTEEEREKIRAKYNELKSLNSISNEMFADDTAILDWLFGADLFKEK